jgi:hypothetical protein
MGLSFLEIRRAGLREHQAPGHRRPRIRTKPDKIGGEYHGAPAARLLAKQLNGPAAIAAPFAVAALRDLTGWLAISRADCAATPT